MTSECAYHGGIYFINDWSKDSIEMTMFFQNAVITQKFIDFCKRRSLHGRVKLEGCKYVVTVEVPHHEQPNFIASWAGMTMDQGPKPKYKENQYMTTLTDDSPMPFGKYGPKSKDPRPLGRVPAGYLLWLWEGNGGPNLHEQNGGLADYIRNNFTVLEQDAPDFIVTNRPDVPRK